MNRRPRQGALALCAALVLLATGISITPAPLERAANSLQPARGASGPVVVPDRFLVQTAALSDAARTDLLAAITATGATVNLVYTDTWDGVSVTASESQLDAISALPGVQESFPVYALQLDDPPAGSVTGEAGGTAGADAPGGPSDQQAAQAARASDDTFTVDYASSTVLDVLANDFPDPEQAPLPDSLVFTDPGATEAGKVLTVAGRGTFSVTADGRVVFVAQPGFAGDLEPVTYQVGYPDGASEVARISVSVASPAPPVASDDVANATTPGPASADVLANDHSGAGLRPESLCLPDAEACPSRLDVPEGTWEVQAGKVGFTPAPGFTGAVQVGYRIGDELGRQAEATLTVTISQPPSPSDKHGATAYRTPVSVNLVADAQGEGGAAIDPGSLLLLDPAAATVPELVVPGEGTYAVVGESVRFTPAEGFSGNTVPVRYQLSDVNGATATAGLHFTVGAAPQAADDTARTVQGAPATLHPLANDTPGDDGAGVAVALAADSVVFLPSGSSAHTSAEGEWTAAADGTVRFEPAAAFHGTASVAYSVSDANANTATATITVTVLPAPVARDDSAHAPAGHDVTGIAVLANDDPGDAAAPLQPQTLRLTGAGSSEDGHSRTTADGTWTLHADATVSFSPAAGFHGESTSTGYTVADANATLAAASITVRIGALTTAADYARTTPQNVTVTLSPLDLVSVGDTGELDPQGQPVPGTLDLASMVFTAAGTDQPTVLVEQGVGRWELDRTTGLVTFDPESAYAGTASAQYRITDSFGNAATATITVAVDKVVPAMTDDAAHTPANHPVTVPVLENDTPGHESAGLNPASLALWHGTPAEPWTREPLTTPQGTWSVAGSAITFVPAQGESGRATLQYSVADANGTPGIATVEVNVGALPLANDDATTVPQDGSARTLQPLANDTAGDDGTGTSAGFDPASVVLTDDDATDAGKKLSRDGYTLSVNSAGGFDFAPDWRFTGTVSTGYRVTDAYGNSAAARFVVTVTPTAPTATEQRLAAIGALDTGVDGDGIKVGVIDSGIDYTHPDLGGTAATQFGPTAPRVRYGYDFVGDQYDPSADENDPRRQPVPDGNPADCNGHGTHVAGIVGADGNPKRAGAYGVAPKVVFGAYRVSGCLGVASSDVIVAALQRADADGMDVVNLSLGNALASWPNDPAYPFNATAAKLVAKGVVVVAAVGNSGRQGLFTAGSPAVAPGVISVAAADAVAGRVEPYSAMGLAADLSLSPTLTAPGSDVYSTVTNGGHQNKGGTSMAAPHVTGAVAEILQARGWQRAAGTPAKVAALLYSTATQVKSADARFPSYAEAVFRQGAGLLRLDAALASTVTASPAVLKLGEGNTESRYVTLSNAGSKAVTYKVSAVTGTSAAASTGTKTNVGNQTPDWAYGAVGFAASPGSVTVQPGKTAKVKVTITAPGRILYGKQGLLYGGWVRFTATGEPTVSVPFAGVRGDYQKVKLLPSSYRSFVDAGTNVTYKLKLPALARRNASGALETITSGTPTFRSYPDERIGHVMFHLDYPASAIRLKAVNTRTKKYYYAVLSGTSTQLGPRGRDEGYSTVPFYGIYKDSKGRQVYIPAGTYKLQLRVLRPLGSSGTSSHWETLTTRELKLVR